MIGNKPDRQGSALLQALRRDAVQAGDLVVAEWRVEGGACGRSSAAPNSPWHPPGRKADGPMGTCGMTNRTAARAMNASGHPI